MSVVSVNPKSFILALFIRDDDERFLLGDSGYDFKDSQLHFVANTMENDEVAKQGADGVMLAGQVRRASVQPFDGYIGDATDTKDQIEEKRKAFIAFFAKGHHFRVVYVDCNRNAWQRKGGYIVDAPEVKEIWQIHPEYHVGLNFEDVNYYSYNEDAQGNEILSNEQDVPIAKAVSGGLEWDEDGAVSEDAEVEYITETAEASGRSISISDAAEAPLASFQLDGETSQNGTPTPSAPVPVNTVTGENVVKICGKNLQDSSSFSDYYIDNSGNLVAGGGLNGLFGYTPVKPSTQYTLSAGEYTKMSIAFYNGTTFISRDANHDGASHTFTTPNNCTAVRCWFYHAEGVDQAYLDGLKIQLEAGSQRTEFEPYKAHSYEVNLGKNLLDDSITGSITWQDTTVSFDGDEITINKLSTGAISAGARTNAISCPLYSGQTYTLSLNYKSGTILTTGATADWQFLIYGVKSDGTTTSYLANARPDRTSAAPSVASASFTPTDNLVGYKLGCYIPSAAPNTSGDVIFDCQLELGSATTYSPYFEPIELCKIGTYQDYIWNDNGTWKVHKAIGKNVFTGSEQWFRSGRTTATVFMASTEVLSLTIKNDERNQSLSSHFKFLGSTGIGNFDLYNGTASAQYLVFGLDATSVPDVTAAKAWITANQPTIYYVLTTPTDTEITNEALVAQLEALRNNARTYAGTNNIFTITPNEQGTLEISYYTEYQPVVVGGGYVWEAGGSGGPTTVVNDSISNVSPIWTVHGPVLNPILENTTTNEEIEYVGMIADGQTLVVDMGEQTAFLNGLNVVSNIVGDYISLAPGRNILLYSATSGDEDSEIGWSEIVG